MKHIKLFEQFSTAAINEARLPSNVAAWLKDSATSSQEQAAKKVAGWVEKAGAHISGGTSIGKSPQTLILDVKYQGSEIYINADGVIKFEDQEVDNIKDFKKMFEVYKRSSPENRKYFKVPEDPKAEETPAAE